MTNIQGRFEKMAKMFLMCGDPGSGKSFFARKLAKDNGYRYLSIDDMYAVFNGDPHSHDNKFDVWMTFWRQIHAAEMAGHDIVVDTNAPTRLDRNEFLNWFASFEHHLIWVEASEELCLRNNANRSRVIPREQMKAMFAFFEPPDIRENMGSHRSKWASISYVPNNNNRFGERITTDGHFPEDTIA